MKRLSRWLSVALAAGFVVVAMWGGLTQTEPAEAKTLHTLSQNLGTAGPLTVAGDSTTYYLYDYVLPTWDNHKDNSGYGDSTAAQCAANWSYTSLIDTRSCDGLSLYGHGSWDSLYYKLQYTVNGVTWTTFIDSTLSNSTAIRSFPPVQGDWTQLVYTQLSHSAAVVDTIFDQFDWLGVRIGYRLGDVRTVISADTSLASAVIDTAINVQFRVLCSD